MTDDEVDDYVRHLHAHLPPAQRHLTVEQVRTVLDAETAYYERRFGPIHGWRAMLRAFIGFGDPSPSTLARARPAFEAYVMQALSARGDLTPEDIRAVMQVEDEAGPRWTPPAPPADGDSTTAPAGGPD